jgi:hypothetical protein
MNLNLEWILIYIKNLDRIYKNLRISFNYSHFPEESENTQSAFGGKRSH